MAEEKEIDWDMVVSKMKSGLLEHQVSPQPCDIFEVTVATEVTKFMMIGEVSPETAVLAIATVFKAHRTAMMHEMDGPEVKN